jgi:hypothetical protein
VITLKVRIPAPSSMLLANVLGVLALIGLAVAIGGITHNGWWALLAGSLEAFGLSAVWTVRIEGSEGSEEDALVLKRAA